MKQYAVIHAVRGLQEGFRDTTCEFFPKRSFADKHIIQILSNYRKDEMCVNIEHQEGGDVEVTMTRQYMDYHACVPHEMSHDDWVAENSNVLEAFSVEVFRIIEVDMSNHSDSTESRWLTWDQQETCVAWDHFPSSMSLVTRVSSDAERTAIGDPDAMYYAFYQFNTFIKSVHKSNHAFISCDGGRQDYVLHAFRIPKKFDTND